MGMQCPKCGTDNLLTAIFCRGCGDKLNLNELKPDTFLKEATKNSKQGATKGQKLFLSIFGGVLLLLVLLAVCPAGGTFSQEEKPGGDSQKHYNSVKKSRSKAKGSSYTFTAQDATTLVTKSMHLPAEGDGGPQPQNFSIDFRPENEIRVVLKCKYFGFLPIDNCVKVRATVANRGSVEFEVLSVKAGQLPALGPLKDMILELVRNQAESCGDLKSIKNNVVKITTSEGSIEIGI